MARRIGNILGGKKAIIKTFSNDNSTLGDNETTCSADGEKSVALTVNSQVTLKASNLKPDESPTRVMKKSPVGKGGWKGLKRFVGATSVDSAARSHSKSEDFSLNKKSKLKGTIWPAIPSRNRILSEDWANQRRQKVAEPDFLPARVTRHLDIALRGRRDGVDIISLGPANKTSLPPKPNNKSKTGLSFDPLRTTFLESSVSREPAELISDMIWSSGGKESPELIFEGFFPGENDRWTVRLESSSCPSDPVARATTDCKENPENEQNTGMLRPRTLTEASDDSTAALTDDGSTNLPTHMLWDHIWGSDEPPPVPSHMHYKADGTDEDDDILQLAAACSVPVDLDEDTFIIASPDHFRSVLDIAMVPLQAQRFDSGLKIFEKLLQGLEEQNDEKFEHLHACTNHNMGIILMCQSEFSQALERFQRAVTIRMNCLPQNHPDIAVSIMRQGEAHFALGNYKEALESFEHAASMSSTEDSTRAKMLNNIGVVHYQEEDFSEALKAFTSALEIQRQWLDGNLRRESIIYDACVTLGNMGKVFLELKEYEVASAVFEEACLLQSTTFRKDHRFFMTSLENLALTHAKSGKYDKSAPILRGILKSREAKLGRDHPSTIETMGILAFVLIKGIDLEEAAVLLGKVSEWQKEHLEPTHPVVKMTTDAIEAVASLMNGNTSLWI